jgi:hypothetical protein
MNDQGNMTGGHMAHMDHAGMGQAQPMSAGSCDPHDENRPPTCGVHNQMMVGQQTIYLSHLPMFMFDPQHHEHNFQVILEVTLSGPGNPQASYAADRQQHPNERMYTMSPAAFEMVELDPRHPRRDTLTGDIFRGHLERGGRKIITGAVARVVNTVYFHAFDRSAQPLAQLEYLLFGKGPEQFLTHVITRPPDFDQILSVTLSGQSISDDDLLQGVRITIPGRANTPHTRIKAGERVTGRVQRAGAPAGQPLALQLEAGTELYFEEGELGDPALPEHQPGAFTMAQTPEERAAGF